MCNLNYVFLKILYLSQFQHLWQEETKKKKYYITLYINLIYLTDVGVGEICLYRKTIVDFCSNNVMQL